VTLIKFGVLASFDFGFGISDFDKEKESNPFISIRNLQSEFRNFVTPVLQIDKTWLSILYI